LAGTQNCADPAQCTFVYRAAATPVITAIAPVTGKLGTVLTLTGTNLDLVGGDGAGAAVFDVSVGNQLCTVAAADVTATAVECTVGHTRAGSFTPYFTNGAVGTARISDDLRFESELTVSGISHSGGSHGGGHTITIKGAGFGGGDPDGGGRSRRDGAWGGWIIYDYLQDAEQVNQNGVAARLCNRECTMVSAAYDEIVCVTPEVHTVRSLALTDTVEPTKLTGTTVSSEPQGSVAFNAAFDSRFETVYTASSADDGCFTGLDLGEGTTAVVSKVRWFPAHQRGYQMDGGVIEASADGQSWTTLHTIAAGATHEGWNFADVDAGHVYRHVRYRGAAGSACTVAQLEFTGTEVSASAVCPVVIENQVPPSHPSRGPSTTDYAVAAAYTTGATYEYRLAQTPIITAVAPPYGSSLGGTTLVITGTGLPRTAAAASVEINGRACAVTAAAADGTEVQCLTSRRTDFRPLSVNVVDTDGGTGTGRAVHDQTVTFRYLDRWSAVNTWLNDEPPVAGDTVIVPADQAILVDIPLPKLFLVLIQGFLMFEPNSKHDLNMDATYILVYGGALRAGTEAEPFEGNLNITLHGDRYTDVEIPSFGVKVLAVADRGGLSRSSFANGAGHEVPLSQRGILDIHGKRRIATWVHVAESAMAGDTEIHTSEPVDFAPGETIVLTGHVAEFTGAGVRTDLEAMKEPPCMYPPPSKMTTEERVVLELRDGGRTIVFEEPLEFDHISKTVTTAESGTVVELRAQVALLTRNIKIQGDDTSPEQLFGSHTIAVHGGHFRVENAEVRNCGQAGDSPPPPVASSDRGGAGR
jgi:hypothetical protein